MGRRNNPGDIVLGAISVTLLVTSVLMVGWAIRKTIPSPDVANQKPAETKDVGFDQQEVLTRLSAARLQKPAPPAGKPTPAAGPVATAPRPPQLRLQSLYVGQRSRFAVIVQGGRKWTVGEGDQVAGATVMRITAREVTLVWNNQSIKLSIAKSGDRR